MRWFWRGAVFLGLVAVGVRLSSAAEGRDLRFHQVRGGVHGRRDEGQFRLRVW
jgi:non-homologous end joining protein Ku